MPNVSSRASSNATAKPASQPRPKRRRSGMSQMARSPRRSYGALRELCRMTAMRSFSALLQRRIGIAHPREVAGPRPRIQLSQHHVVAG